MTYECTRCGGEIEMTEERRALMANLPGGVALSHDVCPDEALTLHDYRVRIVIERTPHVDDPDELDPLTVPIELARVGTTITAPSFPVALERLGDELAPQWEAVRAMAFTVEDDLDGE